MRCHRRLIAVAGLIVGVALAPRAGNVRVAADAPSYTIEDLGVAPDGLVPTLVTGLNASGQVSGMAATSQAVRFTNGAGFEFLTGFDTTSTGRGINVWGDVVGYAPIQGGMRAFRHVGGTPQFVEPLADGTFTVGLGINKDGLVVGYTNTPDGFRGFRAMPGVTLEVLPTLENGFTLATAVNDAGQIAGTSTLATNIQHAFRLDDTGMHDLGSFGLSSMSAGFAIDAGGDVVGRSAYDDGRTHAFRYSAGQLQDIDTLSMPFSTANAVSGKWTVGFFQDADFNQHAFVHTHADGMVDLNTRIDPASGWYLLEADGVNESGQIVGIGWFNGAGHVFRLTRSDKTPPVISSVTASPSTLVPPNNLMVDVTVKVDATDDSGEVPVCSITSITGGSANDHSVTGALTAQLRAVANTTYTLVVECADGSGNKASAATAVDVPPDRTPPVITSLTATPSIITPPNGARVNVTTEATATDDSGQTPICTLESITGPGTQGVDFGVTGPNAGFVLAVGDRTYAFTEKCVDGSNNVARQSVNVVVPPDTTPPVITSLSASPSTIAVPNNQMVPVTISYTATDDSGATPVCAVTGVTSPGPAADGVVTGPLAVSVRAVGGRTYTVQFSCKDPKGNTTNAGVAVVVLPDTEPPVISSVSLSPSNIWPPNHQFVGVSVTVFASDNSGDVPECAVTMVTSSEGYGTDAVITGPLSVSLRAEKDRVYSVHVTCDDDAGNMSEGFANVAVTKTDNGTLKAVPQLLTRRLFLHGHHHKK